MAIMHPKTFPHDRKRKPKLLGEKLAFDALHAGLGDSWSVFYDRPVAGTQRRVDFIAIDPAHGAIAIEVKGGTVHAACGGLRELIGRSGMHKRTNPFGQLKMAFARVCDAVHYRIASTPLRLMMCSIARAGPDGRLAPRSSCER